MDVGVQSLLSMWRDMNKAFKAIHEMAGDSVSIPRQTLRSLWIKKKTLQT